MAKHLNLLLSQLRRWSGSPSEEDSDSQLLERFLTHRDEAAFAALVRRHGPMVFGLCRRLLHNEQDAEDAFQAAFLVLARKAASVRRHRSLGGWLHEVAYHLALRAKNKAMRQRKYEREDRAMTPSEDPSLEASRRELCALLDEELRQLPAKYRQPLILCYLEGKTNEQAAHQLGWPLGSMSRRLDRGRELLRQRLVGRGVSLPVGVLAAALIDEAASASVLPLLAASAVRMVLQVSATGIPASVAVLVKGGIGEMFSVKLRLALVLTLTTIGVGAGALVYQRWSNLPIERQIVLIAKAADEQPRIHLYRDPVLHDDPLPPGALVRLGSIRLRHLSATVIFSPDGKQLISAGADGTIRYWEPTTGKEKRRVRVQTEDSFAAPQVFAANGNTVTGMTSKDICVWETATGKELFRFPIDKIPFPGFGNRLSMVWRLDLSADGKLLAVQFDDFKDHNLHLWNVHTGKKLFTLKPRQSMGSLKFFSDGKLLGTVSHTEGLQFWDTTTGEEVRKIAGAIASGGNALAFSPDGKRVASHSLGGVKVWNVADGREVLNLKTAAETGPTRETQPGSLAFAPDNKTLAINFLKESVFYDVVVGKQVRTLPVKGFNMAFSPASDLAAFVSGSVIHVWDLAAGKEIGPHSGHDGGVHSLAIAPDGGRIATFAHSSDVVRLWDAVSGQPLAHIASDKLFVSSGVFASDSRFFVTGGAGNDLLRLWDSKTGKEVRQFRIGPAGSVHENEGVWSMTLSDDGERLVAYVRGGGDVISTHQVFVWDFATGKRLAQRKLPHAGFEMHFSPNGRSMTNQRDGEVVITDTTTGQELVKSAGGAPMAFSPDGQILALAKFKPSILPPDTVLPVDGDPEDTVCLVELTTGKKLLCIKTGEVGHHLLAFSSDGRTLATADRDRIRLWDAATGKELLRRELPEKFKGQFGYSFVTSLAFLPDGNRLATGLMDGTVLIWDLAPKTWRAGIAVQDLDRRDLEHLWADLAGQDAGKAHRAVWTLAAVPAKTVPFLKDRLQPVAALDAEQVQKLIADLDSPEFTVREAANKKLASFGEQVEPALRQALEGKPSLEKRKRLEALHTDAELTGRGIVHSVQVLRTLRAIRVLEHIGEREARQLLQTLASGDAAARSTRQAKEALQRLERRSAP